MLGKPPPTEMTLEQLVQEENLTNTSIGKSDDNAIDLLGDSIRVNARVRRCVIFLICLF